MQCAKCGNLDTKVIDSRLTDKNKAIRRRRECEKCLTRFTTFERMQIANLVVIKKNSTREPYDREKLLRGILIACSKRPVTREQINQMINDLEEKIIAREREIKSETLGRMVMEKLKSLDNIAYVRFASVYKDFRDVAEFKNVLKHFDTP